MVNSSVDICNMALIFLGANTIISLDDGSKVADVCKSMYPQVLEEVFDEHEWDCLINRVELTAVESDSSEYSYQYSLPEDCRVVLDVFPDSDYIIEGRILFSNESELAIRYVKKDEDPKQYDILLGYVIAYKLALEIADSLTQNTSLVADLVEEYEDTLKLAKGVNLSESQEPEPVENNSWPEAGRT